ncbi:MAG: hypothetical protein KTR25_12280 [Myxococcales bacterium]|nr:hypothetical protein [Myxococcales bacterium]
MKNKFILCVLTCIFVGACDDDDGIYAPRFDEPPGDSPNKPKDDSLNKPKDDSLDAPQDKPSDDPQDKLPVSSFICPTDDSLYFCDDFEDGMFDDTWDDLIETYGLATPGRFDILDQGDGGKSLRFTAGTRGPNAQDGELILVKPSAFSNVPSDHYVEYRIRPRGNSNTGNKYLYAMVRYQGQLQWYFGGLNVQNSTSSTRVEAGSASVDGGLSRPSQVATPIEIGAQGETDGVWYTVRLDVIGNMLTTYINGEALGTWVDEDNLYPETGLIGFYTYNRSFEIDYVRVGDPNIKPVQLSLDFSDSLWQVAADGDPLVINVTAIQDDGLTEDTFRVSSTDEEVVAIAVDGSQVTLTPVGQGTASIIFVSDSDASVRREIRVNVEPPWVMPNTDYGDNISERLTPLPDTTNEYPDVTLTITFDGPPSLGTNGEVRIFNAADDTLVDRLRVSAETNELGYPGQERVRILNTKLVSTSGNVLVIKPHNQVLDYNQQYYVAVGEDVVTGVQLGGAEFTGLGKNANWTFRTLANGPAENRSELTVDDDGEDADFRTVQRALDWVMEHAGVDADFTLNIKDGVYNEHLYLRNIDRLKIVGESQDGTIIEAENYEATNSGSGGSVSSGSNPSGGRSLFLVEGGDLLTLTNLTMRNTHIRTGSGDQAEALYFNSPEGRLISIRASFYSEQDTLQLKGYNWFFESLVAGNVDFIWGSPVATVFERSEIRSLGDSRSSEATSSGGYILQARVRNESDPGFVFINSALTQGASRTGVTIDAGTTYLARSSGNSDAIDNITFINTTMDTHIAEIGWAYLGINGQPAPQPRLASANAGWKEFGSMDINGKPLVLRDRCDSNGSCYELTEAEMRASFCHRSQVFASFDSGAGWDPLPEDSADDNCAEPAQ